MSWRFSSRQSCDGSKSDVYYRLAEHTYWKKRGRYIIFASRAEGFGIKTNKKELIAYYAKRLSKYTGEEVSYSQLLYEDSASTLFTTFMFWAYYLEDAPYERVALFFHSMVESYQSIIKK